MVSYYYMGHGKTNDKHKQRTLTLFPKETRDTSKIQRTSPSARQKQTQIYFPFSVNPWNSKTIHDTGKIEPPAMFGASGGDNTNQHVLLTLYELCVTQIRSRRQGHCAAEPSRKRQIQRAWVPGTQTHQPAVKFSDNIVEGSGHDVWWDAGGRWAAGGLLLQYSSVFLGGNGAEHW